MTASVPVVLERDNVNDESVTLVRWFAQNGERVEADTLLAEIETSKANVEVHAPEAGFLIQNYAEGAEVPVTSAIGYISKDAPENPTSAPVAFHGSAPIVPPDQKRAAGSDTEPTVRSSDGGFRAGNLSQQFPAPSQYRQRFSPVAARMMEANGLKPADFPGLSIVRKRDVLDRLNPGSATITAPRLSSPEVITSPITQPYRTVVLSKMKRRESAALAGGVRNALSSAVSVTCFTRGLRRAVEMQMPGESASAVIVYEISRLLRKYPVLNATHRDGQMLQYEQVNVGYAMDDGRGLKVAVLPECDKLSLQDIAAQLRELTVAYLTDKLSPAQIANATFTISDLSGAGASDFLPLISENQGAILGVSAEQYAPDGAFGVYNLTLAFDHQIGNGRTAALFLNDLKERLHAYEQTVEAKQTSLVCLRCGRTGAELSVLKHFLLRSAVPEGYVCTLCVSGY